MAAREYRDVMDYTRVEGFRKYPRGTGARRANESDNYLLGVMRFRRREDKDTSSFLYRELISKFIPRRARWI